MVSFRLKAIHLLCDSLTPIFAQENSQIFLLRFNNKMGLLRDDRYPSRNDHLVDEFISTCQYIMYAISS